MIDGKRIAVVMPAYNAERTLEKTVRELPGDRRHQDSRRRLEQRPHRRLSESLGVQTFIHDAN